MADFELGNFDYQKLEHHHRRGFIRKVYSILVCQLTFTFGISLLSSYVQSFGDFLKDNLWFFITCGVATIILILVIFCFHKLVRKYPTNFILLSLFTIFQTFVVATITAYYDPTTVLAALVMTIGVTFGLTVYALATKKDFTICYGILFGLLSGLCFFGVCMVLFYDTRAAQMCYCLIWIVIYSIYIVIDTQYISGGHRYELSYDDYIIGALILYVDIVGLFIYILSLIGGRK